MARNRDSSIRCAIYTRKSTNEGLEQEFNSLDAQRESAEAYIASQKHEGWKCLPDRYDDGGYTGGNMERPALKRLLADLEAERKALERQLERDSEGLRKLVSRSAQDGLAAEPMADLQDRIRTAEQRTTQVLDELITLGRELIDEKEAARILGTFDPVWETLSPREQVRVIRLLVEQVSYDGRDGTVSVALHPTGIKALAEEMEEVPV